MVARLQGCTVQIVHEVRICGATMYYSYSGTICMKLGYIGQSFFPKNLTIKIRSVETTSVDCLKDCTKKAQRCQ